MRRGPLAARRNPNRSIGPTAKRIILGNCPGQDWNAQQITRQDLHRATHRQRGIDAGVREIERDFAAGIAKSNDEHAFADIGRGVAIFAAVNAIPPESIEPRPGRTEGKIGQSGCNHDNRR
jgi:hypothetical protein